ncbi:MAG: NAD-dependent glyceraldehyde-3-phosphate dehydrogenase, partial [uncultured Thermoleophilia bacterium]
GNACRDQRLRPHRPELPALGDQPGRRARRRGDQRPDGRANAGAPLPLRLDVRAVRGDGRGPGVVARHQRRRDPHPVREGSGKSALEGPRRARRRRVDRLLRRPGERLEAPRRRRAEGHHLRARQGARRHARAGRERRGLRPRAAPHHLAGVVHDELPRTGGADPARRVRHRARLHDHHARVHERPADPRRAAQGPASGAVRGALGHPDLDRGGEGDRPRDPGAEGPARRLCDARARPRRLRRRPDRRARPGRLRGRHQRRRPRPGRHGPARGRPAVHRGPDRLVRHRRLVVLVRVRQPAHDGERAAGQGRLLVRQRVRVLEPARGPRHPGPV